MWLVPWKSSCVQNALLLLLPWLTVLQLKASLPLHLRACACWRQVIAFVKSRMITESEVVAVGAVVELCSQKRYFPNANWLLSLWRGLPALLWNAASPSSFLHLSMSHPPPRPACKTFLASKPQQWRILSPVTSVPRVHSLECWCKATHKYKLCVRQLSL